MVSLEKVGLTDLLLAASRLQVAAGRTDTLKPKSQPQKSS